MPTYLERPHPNFIASGITRAIGDSWQNDSGFLQTIKFNIRLSVTNPLQSSQEAYVAILVGTADPADVEIDRFSVESQQVAGLSLIPITDTQQGSISAEVPSGYWVKLVQGGTGIASIVGQQVITYSSEV